METFSVAQITEKVGLIGGGRMGRALVQGMITAGVLTSDQVTVAEIDPGARSWWVNHVPDVEVTADTARVATESKIVILAVKPEGLKDVAAVGKGQWGERLVVSVAAGVTLKALREMFKSKRVVRVMPNTPALIGSGASVFCCDETQVFDADTQNVVKILEAVGVVARVQENAIDAATGLSGSGPAYVFMLIEAMTDGGVAAGLPRQLALQLATQTVLGAARMVAETGQHPAVLKDAVVSPGGTTIAGLSALEQNGIRAAMINAVTTAAERSRELGAY